MASDDRRAAAGLSLDQACRQSFLQWPDLARRCRIPGQLTIAPRSYSMAEYCEKLKERGAVYYDDVGLSPEAQSESLVDRAKSLDEAYCSDFHLHCPCISTAEKLQCSHEPMPSPKILIRAQQANVQSGHPFPNAVASKVCSQALWSFQNRSSSSRSSPLGPAVIFFRMRTSTFLLSIAPLWYASQSQFLALLLRGFPKRL